MPLSLEQLQALEEEGKANVGLAREQVAHFVTTVQSAVESCPDAKELSPESIL